MLPTQLGSVPIIQKELVILDSIDKKIVTLQASLVSKRRDRAAQLAKVESLWRYAVGQDIRGQEMQNVVDHRSVVCLHESSSINAIMVLMIAQLPIDLDQIGGRSRISTIPPSISTGMTPK